MSKKTVYLSIMRDDFDTIMVLAQIRLYTRRI
jgi:hypothetical protein